MYWRKYTYQHREKFVEFLLHINITASRLTSCCLQFPAGNTAGTKAPGLAASDKTFPHLNFRLPRPTLRNAPEDTFERQGREILRSVKNPIGYLYISHSNFQNAAFCILYFIRQAFMVTGAPAALNFQFPLLLCTKAPPFSPRTAYNNQLTIAA